MRTAIVLLLVTALWPAQQYTPQEKKRIESGDLRKELPIYQTTDPYQHRILLTKSQPADARDPLTRTLIERMKLSLLSTEGGVGIAAPQVGINRKIIWVQRFDKESHPLEYFINPEIRWRSELLNLGPEGDLSIPEFRDMFYRSKVIEVSYQDLDGVEHQEIIEGFTAVIVQHEIDHLFGILISDKIERQKEEHFRKVEAYLKD